ncbi:hypothetical protein, unlikely [Trypanosoma brucei gambiense DAL972]|uniref:Uncharacterized protein n=1 Tax=Trypanosoma brucei gambiense (strain MHOM/CI/86/DAL972) TaxID=679716 RepID=C9ZNP4_TRYB9|nr:hypothetical protein, unlikely [Trypanosoma brucei gambiense DAL972]CBH11022.1 hypothetical protein, unlikely [Trypanosoma brucei gambiense DAL972]|eukprot:XP_011773309.1 hypothetical protein, unlikely [Trypanosoma brucei gambiense DAL972]
MLRKKEREIRQFLASSHPRILARFFSSGSCESAEATHQRLPPPPPPSRLSIPFIFSYYLSFFTDVYYCYYYLYFFLHHSRAHVPSYFPSFSVNSFLFLYFPMHTIHTLHTRIFIYIYIYIYMHAKTNAKAQKRE